MEDQEYGDDWDWRALRDAMVRKEHHFDFGVYPITDAEAGALMDQIVVLVEEMDANIGGGSGPYTWMDDAQHWFFNLLFPWWQRVKRLKRWVRGWRHG